MLEACWEEDRASAMANRRVNREIAAAWAAHGAG